MRITELQAGSVEYQGGAEAFKDGSSGWCGQFLFRGVGRLLSFSEAKNNPVMSLLQPQDMCVCFCPPVCVSIVAFSPLFSVTVHLCGLTLKKIIHSPVLKLEIKEKTQRWHQPNPCGDITEIVGQFLIHSYMKIQ